MSQKRPKEAAEFPQDELERQEGEELPDREAMSVIDPTGPYAPPPFYTLPIEPPTGDEE